MAYLLDTNALSEPGKPQPNSGFVAWYAEVPADELHASCITVGELYKGIALMADGVRRERLAVHTVKLCEAFGERLLVIDLETTRIWAALMAAAAKRGRPAPAIDALIAAQCVQHQLTLVTRNIKDFRAFEDLRVHCPWA